MGVQPHDIIGPAMLAAGAGLTASGAGGGMGVPLMGAGAGEALGGPQMAGLGGMAGGMMSGSPTAQNLSMLAPAMMQTMDQQKAPMQPPQPMPSQQRPMIQSSQPMQPPPPVPGPMMNPMARRLMGLG